MARSSTPTKEPGRIKQIWQIAKTTSQQDRPTLILLIAATVLPLLGGIALGVFGTDGNILMLILWIIAGIGAALLGFLIVLSRRVPTVVYRSLEGKTGAAGMVLDNSLGRRWITSSTPVAINPRGEDAIYRVVGRAGVVLVAEGPRSRTQKLSDEERRKVQRVLPGVAVHLLQVGSDAQTVRLTELAKAVRKLPKSLRRKEVVAAGNRLKSLPQSLLPIPKGIDPTRLRAGRPR